MTTIYRNKKNQQYIKKTKTAVEWAVKLKLKDRESGCDLRNVVLRMQRHILKSSLSGGMDLNNAFVISPSQSKEAMLSVLSVLD